MLPRLVTTLLTPHSWGGEAFELRGLCGHLSPRRTRSQAPASGASVHRSSGGRWSLWAPLMI